MSRPAANQPSTTESAPPGVRVGELDAGVVGVVRRGGVVDHTTPDDTPNPTRTTVSWWIGAEDRWHRPDQEPSTRDRLVDGCPVVETLVRIPSGEAVGRCTVARVQGVDRPSYVIDVENASPIPVVFAYVIESSAPMTVSADGVSVAGVGHLALTRPAMGFATAASSADLLHELETGDLAASPPSTAASSAPGAVRPGAVAVLVPLPHTAHAVATFTPGPEPTQTARSLLGDRSMVPSPDRVTAGWAAHRSSDPRLDGGDERRGAVFSSASCDLLLGPAAADGDAPIDVVAAVAAASFRLGRVGSSDLLWTLVDEQRANGSVRSDDPVGATAGLVEAAAAWWTGGGATDVAELLVGPIAKAAHWLGRKRQANAVAGRPDVAAALMSASGMMRDVGQPEVAADLVALAARLDSAASTKGPTAADMILSLGADATWTVAGEPDPTASARFVRLALDEMVAEAHDTVVLAAGWTTGQAGASIEAHDVPTRWGSVSFGLRWHGDRPALLWELAPWPGRDIPGPVAFTAPALDSTWRGAQSSGEALLAAPAVAAAAPAPERSAPTEGGSFS